MTDVIFSADSIGASRPAGGSPRILIVRLSAIGDCVQTMPLACAIRRHFASAKITWVVEKGSADLVCACEAVNAVIVVPKGFARSPRRLWRLRGLLQRQHFDIAFDSQGLTKSGLVAWLSGAKRRIGFARPVARELNPWAQTDCVVSRHNHRVDRYLELLRPLGIERPEVHFGLRIPASADTVALELARRAALRSGFAVLNPGAGWDSKRWPAERYAAVALHLAKRGLPCVVTWGGPREQALAETIVGHAAGAATMAPQTTLLELTAILQQARLFIGSDTGPLHLASAVGTPCVALFGSSLASACGPYGRGHQTLQVALDDHHGRKRPGADNWAMRAISADQVCRACDRVLVESVRPYQSAAA